jgi:type IV pilus assembly protein PilQ
VKQLIFILSFLLINVSISAQVIKRDEQLKSLEEKLKQLSETMPGLKEEIDLSVSDVNIQDFIHAIAQSNKINIHINPDLDMRVNNNFSDVSVSSILIFLCKQYNLDIEIYNNILSISNGFRTKHNQKSNYPKS